MAASMDHVEGNTKVKEENIGKPRRRQVAAAVFMGFGAGVSLLGGFFVAKSMVKQNNAEEIRKSMRMRQDARVHVDAVGLARRALGLGTLYAFSGCGVLFFILYKLLDVKDGYELREKVRKVVPAIKPSKEPQGRTEFDSFTDLFQYLEDEDRKQKLVKALREKKAREESEV